jgi:hypothetical protein
MKTFFTAFIALSLMAGAASAGTVKIIANYAGAPATQTVGDDGVRGFEPKADKVKVDCAQ